MTSRLKPPLPQTLKKYGMDAETWYTLIDLQNSTCPVCGDEFSEERRPVIDHEHRRGFKKMKPVDKFKCVRGVLHNYCNRRLVAKGMTAEKAYNIYQYLSDYDMRKDDQ